MNTVNLFRIRRSDHGTEGLVFVEGFQCRSMELPWRDNEQNYSCIPPGTYHVRIRYSPKYGRTFHLLDVEGRSYILIHSGNWAGDRKKGLKTHTYGCLLFGEKHGVLVGQRAVLFSRPIIRRFMEVMGEEFTLNIYELWKEA